MLYALHSQPRWHQWEIIQVGTFRTPPPIGDVLKKCEGTSPTIIGRQIINIYGSDSNGCGRNGLLSGVFDLFSGEHQSSGEYMKRASLDVSIKRH